MLIHQLTAPGIGEDIYAFAAKLFPVCRSITGNGVRETLRLIGAHIPLQLQEIPTGTKVLDWTIPCEWNVRDAYIKNTRGEKVVDFEESNLHVVSYSVPVHRQLRLAELRKHIHTLPDQPAVIPYRTSYYTEDWGFCMRHDRFTDLADDTYEVLIDTSRKNGFLTYGEYLHKGVTEDEFLLSAHVCHPSLANDNCSGIALLAILAKRMEKVATRHSYRFLFAPGTIGAISWLARNPDKVKRIKHGLVLSMVGDGGGPTYKKSRRGDAMIDRAADHVLRQSGLSPTIFDFSPYGYDERQYCSPGFNLPVGLFQRSAFGTIPEYHTSADDLDFIRSDHLETSYRLLVSILDVIENDAVFVNNVPYGEPQLGSRGLYRAWDDNHDASSNMAMLWLLNLSDGQHSLLDIAERANMPFTALRKAADLLCDHGLLSEVAAKKPQGTTAYQTRLEQPPFRS